jgi:hypothetical protein
MDNLDELDEQVFAVVQRYMDRNKSLTDEGIRMALPTVDAKEIDASLERLQHQGRIAQVPLNICVPNIMKRA